MFFFTSNAESKGMCLFNLEHCCFSERLTALHTVMAKNISTLGKYDQRRL